MFWERLQFFSAVFEDLLATVNLVDPHTWKANQQSVTVCYEVFSNDYQSFPFFSGILAPCLMVVGRTGWFFCQQLKLSKQR